MSEGWQRVVIVVGGVLGAVFLLLMIFDLLGSNSGPALLLFYTIAVFIFVVLGCGVAWIVEGFRGRR